MTDLWEHQKRFIALADQLPHAAAFMAPGTGKTRAAIEVLRREYNRGRRMQKTLILCPLSTCKQWGAAIRQYAPKIPPGRILVLTGAGKKRKEKLELERESTHQAIVISNFEAVSIQSFYDELCRWAPELVVLDESHRIKDSSSERAKRIYPLCHGARRRFLLTGTPVLNGLLDVFGQYKALDPEIFGHSFWKFRETYFYDKNRGMPSHVHFPNWQVKPGSVPEISRIIAETSVQAELKDCLDLPPLVQIKIPVELSSAQAKAYASMEKQFIAELGEVTSFAEFAMTKTLRLRQILCGFVAESADTKSEFFEDCPRMDALEELLESLAGKQVIIWTSFKPLYRRIQSLCTKMRIGSTLLTGDQSISEKEAAISSFTSGTQVLISNPAAGGTGVDGLQCSSYSIYYDRGYSLGEYLQSQARNYRAGSKNKVIHYILETPETLDSVISEVLDSKKSLGDAILAWGKQKNLQLVMPSATRSE